MAVSYTHLLFANVRPVVIPEKNIDWIFYRENTEGEYALGLSLIHILYYFSPGYFP